MVLHENGQVYVAKVTALQVIAADDMNGVWFEDLLRTLLKADAESKSSSVLLCCEQIVNLLVQKMITIEEAVGM
jgi:hypothetical protein